MSKKAVAIVGTGPTAIFAARAARDCGYQVDIFTVGNNPIMNYPGGAFWLHWIPPDLEIAATPIFQVGLGNELNYRKLQWGASYKQVPDSSFPKEKDFVFGYNPAQALPALLPKDANLEVLIAPLSDTEMGDLANGYDAVFQTFPTKLSKEQQPPTIGYIVATTDNKKAETDFVVYNGSGAGPIVREAHLWGKIHLEFPKNFPRDGVEQFLQERQPDSRWELVTHRDFAPGTKPWSQPENSNPKIHLIGRWAEWNNKRLTHEIYSLVCGMLKSHTTNE